MDTVREETSVAAQETDPWVPTVRDALMHAWFPNGHLGETIPELAEDYTNWLENATLDAEVAVKAIREITGTQ